MSLRLLVTFSLLLLLSPAAVFADAIYQFERQIPIGGEGGWDILTIDSAHRLYLAHATKVVVVDLEKNAVAGEIADTPGIHGFVAVPELGRGFSTNGQEAKTSVVDLQTLRTLTKIPTSEGPDEVLYEPKRGEVYVFNHRGDSATVIDAQAAKVVTTISLGGSPEFAVADSATGRVYCNLEDKSEVAAIDTAKHEVVARWPLAPGTEPGGIALDATHHRLFSACHNKLITMLDTTTGKVVATAPIGGGPDGCAFDGATHLVFVSCGDGTTTIVKETALDKLQVVQSLMTERGARTLALDPTTHRIYLPTAKFEPAASPAPDVTPTRPKIIPDTLKLLVYGPIESPHS